MKYLQFLHLATTLKMYKRHGALIAVINTYLTCDLKSTKSPILV